jgi:hypothetical protein
MPKWLFVSPTAPTFWKQANSVSKERERSFATIQTMLRPISGFDKHEISK